MFFAIIIILLEEELERENEEDETECWPQSPSRELKNFTLLAI